MSESYAHLLPVRSIRMPPGQKHFFGLELQGLPVEAGHTDDSDTRNRGVKEFCSGVKESEGVE